MHADAPDAPAPGESSRGEARGKEDGGGNAGAATPSSRLAATRDGDRAVTAGSNRRRVSAILIVAGLCWLCLLLTDQIALVEHAAPREILPLAFSILALATSFVASSVLFCLFVEGEARRPYVSGSLVRLYFAGQLLRYLPGRLWGVVYQVSKTTDVAMAVRVARANVDLMAFSMSLNTALALFVLGARDIVDTGIAAALALSVMAALTAHMAGWTGVLLRPLRRFLPLRIRESLSGQGRPRPNGRFLLLASGLHLASWACYLIAWNGLGRAYPQLAHLSFVDLGLLYAVAATIGTFVMLTPAGLGVREASFVTLGWTLADSAELAFVAVVARIWLLVAEIVTTALALCLTRMREIGGSG